MKRPLVERFSEIFRTSAGNKVRLELQDAPDISQEANFQPRKIAVVHKTALVAAGSVIKGRGTAYLLFSQETLIDLVRYRAYEITHYMRWTRPGTTTDPVTGMERDSTPILMDAALPVVIEPARIIADQGIERAKLYIFTGADIRLGDQIGPYTTFTKSLMLGVNQLTVF